MQSRFRSRSTRVVTRVAARARAAREKATARAARAARARRGEDSVRVLWLFLMRMKAIPHGLCF